MSHANGVRAQDVGPGTASSRGFDTVDVSPKLASRWALLLMLASGFASLGYQIVWTEQLGLWLGHESAAVLAVVAAFFGGLSIGGLILGSRIERSARPTRWYAGCEFLIGLWSALLLWVGPGLERGVLRMMGPTPTPSWQWSAAFCGTFLLLLPATAAMGATLPAMERMTAELRAPDRSIARLYATNTLGAVLGVLAAAFWLVPGLGLGHTARICIGLNALCALIAWLGFPGDAALRVHAGTHDLRRGRAALMRLAFTGVLGIGYEVLVVRVLSQVTEDTVYTFALLLAVYLLGTAAGAAAYQRFAAANPDLQKMEARLDQLLGGAASACLLGTACLWGAERLEAWALDAFAGFNGALAAEALLAIVAFGPATTVMGALFSHLTRCASGSGVSFGRALGLNTLGAAIAPALCVVVAAPALGSKFALLLIVAGYLALSSPRAWATKSPTKSPWLPASGALLIALFAPPLRFVEIPEGGRLLHYQEGVLAAVSVVEDADGVARLRINNRQQEGSSATLRVDARQAWLPLLLHTAPRRALFLGLGTGVTARAAAKDPTLEVDAVELLPEVVAASIHFDRAVADDSTRSRLHLLSADARRYVRSSSTRYDVIVSDNFHPARSGSGALYTTEHFEAVRGRLAEDGVFCQWLPLHQLDLETLRSIVQSFIAVYPRGFAMLASNSLETPVIGLLARAEPHRFDWTTVRDRLSKVEVREWLATIGLEDEFALLGSVTAGPQALRRFAANAPANTDDHPMVAYGAPRLTYAPDSTPRDRLVALLEELSIEPDELMLPTQDPSRSRRLAGYWRARDRFIEAGRAVRPSSRVEDMLAQVREPLLAILRTSPDFRPAYDPLIAMATALGRSDAAAARGLLVQLQRLQPARGEATQLLASIDR